MTTNQQPTNIMSNEKKLTPIAMAVEEIEKQKVNTRTIYSPIWDDALNKAIEILEGLKEYERGQRIKDIAYGISRIVTKQGIPKKVELDEYLGQTHTQEGGQG